MDKIKITGVRATGFHGVLPEERTGGQSFVVDCELFLNLTPAIKSDDLAKTIDYAEVSLIIREAIEGPALNLIEALAGRIADAIIKRYRRVQRVVVTVHKPEAPIPVDFLDVSVVIERKR
ncbi:MAG: dihydroneopterin aldolase [Actinobacteria bacterium]|jgi:dihydroneopterin aldolase|nr:dihydroneopterin aldolase [Actinomycetota bacterium]